MLFKSVFLKKHKKNMSCQKRPKWCFWRSRLFLNICASIVFKAESEPKHEELNFWGVFLQKPLFWGSKIVVFETQIANLFFFVCSLTQKEASCQFSLKILIFGPHGIFLEMKTLTHVRPRTLRAEKCRFVLLNSYLTFDYLTCSDQ